MSSSSGQQLQLGNFFAACSRQEALAAASAALEKEQQSRVVLPPPPSVSRARGRPRKARLDLSGALRDHDADADAEADADAAEVEGIKPPPADADARMLDVDDEARTVVKDVAVKANAEAAKHRAKKRAVVSVADVLDEFVAAADAHLPCRPRSACFNMLRQMARFAMLLTSCNGTES